MTNTVDIYRQPQPTYGYQYGPGVFNTQMAQAGAAGDERYHTKQLDRAGMSRGGAQKFEAGNRAAGALADGIAQAYTQRDNDQAQLSRWALGAEADQERMAQALNSIQNQRALQDQQFRFGLLQGLL